MGRKLFTFVGTLVFLTTTSTGRRREVIDRIVATVNGHIILLSDWEDSLRYEAFSSGRPLDGMTAEDRKSALDHLIDQELLREQLKDSDIQHASSGRGGRSGWRRFASNIPEAETELGWRTLLDRYRLNEENLKSRVAAELDLMRLVDARLRPSVTVDSKSIESYYSQELSASTSPIGRAECSAGGSHSENQGTPHPEENQPVADRMAAGPAGGKRNPRRGADGRVRRP